MSKVKSIKEISGSESSSYDSPLFEKKNNLFKIK